MGFRVRLTLAAGALLTSAALATPAAQASQGCTLHGDLTFSRQISIKTSTGDLALSDFTTSCGGVERTLTGWGYFGSPTTPVREALGASPDTCFSGVEDLDLYAPAARVGHRKLAPLWIDLTLTRRNTTFTAAGTSKLGSTERSLTGTGSFAPSTTGSCEFSGWTGGSVSLALSDG